MGTIHHGATLTPHFRDFLPGWLVTRPWYVGTGTPGVRPVGYFRFEDPAGEVGIETHLLENDGVLYHVPLTYRGAPLPGTQAPIATPEHSVLGTRYIYDAEADPVWRDQVLRTVDGNGVSDPSAKRGVGPAEARGERRTAGSLLVEPRRIDLVRTPGTAEPPIDDVAGLLIGTWVIDGATASGCLAVVR